MLNSINFFPVTFRVRIHSKKQLIIFSNILRDMNIDIRDIDVDIKDILSCENLVIPLPIEKKELCISDIINDVGKNHD